MTDTERTRPDDTGPTDDAVAPEQPTSQRALSSSQRALSSSQRALSSSQRALWSSQRRHPHSSLQNMALLSHLDGPVEPQRLARAFAAVVQTSDVLRTRVRDEEGHTVVDIVDEAVAPSEIIELARSEAAEWARARVATPIDLAVRPFDSVIMVHDDGTTSWYLALHHVVTDASSSSLVFDATAAAYFADLEGPDDAPGIDLLDLGLASYREWMGAQAAEADSPRRIRARKTWADREPAPLLDALYQPVRRRTTENFRQPVELGDDLHRRVVAALAGPYRMLSHDLAWTAFLLSVAAVNVHRVSGADSFSLGIPIHNRSSAASRSVVGPLMEVYPVDISVDPAGSFADLHRSVGRSLLKTVGAAHPDIGASAADISGIVNVIPRAGLGSFGTIASTTEWIHPGAADPNHLIGLQLTTYGSDTPRLFVDLNAAAADPEHRRAAPGHLETIIAQMVADPEALLTAEPIVSAVETERLLQWGTGPLLEAGRSNLLLPRLRRALADHDEIVIVDGSSPLGRLTGAELWNLTGRLARWLRDRGVGRGDHVVIEMGRSIETVAMIIATLRAGAAYVPVDPDQPEARRRRLAERVDAAIVITALPDDPLPDDPVLDVGLDQASPDDRAYVLFTSGSTGEPKGVPISHQGVADYLRFAEETYLEPGQSIVAPLFSPLAFDLTVTSLFLPLLAQGELVVVRDGSTAGLRQIAENRRITWLKATPSHLEVLVRMLPPGHGLRRLVVGGEAFVCRLAREVADRLPGVRIFNEYGPTEAVVGCMIHEWHDDPAQASPDVPIGVPVPGVTLRIVDGSGNLVPRGTPGELLIASPGLTAGYLGSIDSDGGPFLHIDGRRFYRSGDLVRLLDPETAVYLGRIDEQIKVNGIRLDPAEVQAGVEEHPAVTRAAVRLWEPGSGAGGPAHRDRGRSQLAVWFEVAADAVAPTAAELRAFLLARLAPHQIPVRYAAVDRLRFNRNGKLDVSSLPEPSLVSAADRTTGSDAHPADVLGPTELAVQQAWAESLGVPAAQPADDFFVLGGDSLAALETAAALSESLGFEVPESLVFAATTLADLAAAIDALEIRSARSGPTRRPEGTAPEPSVRERSMLFDHRSRPDSPRFNLGRHYRLGRPGVGPGEGSERLRRAVRQVVARHEPLHWTFSTPRLELAVDDALDWTEVAGLTPEQARDRAATLHRTPFDLDNGPLLRVELQHLSDGTTGVAIACHHISGDAGSLDRLWREVEQCYLGLDPVDLPVSYADHAAWQQQRLGPDTAHYWSQLWSEGAVTDLGLEPPIVAGRSGYVQRAASFDADELRAGPGTTATATALAALASLLDRMRGGHQTEVGPTRFGVGVTASARDHGAAEPLVGYLLNTLPLVVSVEADDTLAAVAQTASSVLASSLPHRALPLAEMVAAARRTGAPMPRPSVLLAVTELAPATLGELPAEHEVLASGESIADATVFFHIRGNLVDLGVEFDGGVMDERRAELLLADLDAMVRCCLADPERRPSAVALPSVEAGRCVGPAVGELETMPSVLARNMERRPQAPAVRCGDDRITWAELDRRSNAVARAVGARLGGADLDDPSRDRRVIVAIPRSVDLIVAVVGILRAGAAYVPIDPSYPADRIDRIVDAAGAELAVTAGDGSSILGNDHSMSLLDLQSLVLQPDVLQPDDLRSDDIDQLLGGDAAPEAAGAGAVAGLDDAAYVIFTSGSTGRPKGVRVTHRQLASSTRARDLYYGAGPERFLLLSSIGFDSSVAGLFWTLASGGELVIPTESEVHDPDALLGLFDSAAVSHTLMVPSLYGAMLERGRGQEAWPSVAVVAGEACPAALVARHEELRPGSALHNEYGPTEATVWTTVHRCRPDENPTPIGGPIPGAWIAVVDGQGRPLPLGVRGELVVGGANVTDGYVSIVDASADEVGPFTVLPAAGPGPVYRTGDLASISHDRSGERVALFLGRVDDQLNVGGMRVEPGEIEAAMLTVVDVAVAAAVAVDRPRPQIIGWVERHSPEAEGRVTPRTDEPRPVDREVAAALEAAVARSIPTAARPARYLELDALPRTPHGKVDRASLAAIDVSTVANTVDGSPTAASTDTSTETHSPIVARVLEAFRNELQRPDFGPDDDFFDAGGDSLAALTLAVTLEEAFGQSVSVTALLQEPTARAVARQFDVERAEQGSAPSSDDVDVEPGVPDRESQPVGAAHAAPVGGRTTGAPIGLVEWIRPPREQDQSVLVLVAPGSGHLLGYRHLVDALPTDTALLGVRLPGHDGKKAPAITVRRQASAVEPAVEKALAEFSVERDRCLLFGGSSGGLLAWELEQRAEAAGRPFGTVMMQDTLHPQGRLEADQGEGLLGSLGAIKSIPLRIAARQVTSRARALRNDVLSRVEVARTRRAQVDPEDVAKRLFRAANDSSVTYRVAPIHCHVHFIGASQTDGRLTHLRWEDVAADFRLTIIEGEHHGERGITSAGKAGQVAEIVTAELERLSR